MTTRGGGHKSEKDPSRRIIGTSGCSSYAYSGTDTFRLLEANHNLQSTRAYIRFDPNNNSIKHMYYYYPHFTDDETGFRKCM